HVRTPIILSTSGAVVSLSFLETPIDLGAPDGREVDTFFFLICPTVHVHLAMLSRLAHALRDDTFREAVRGRAENEILDAARRLESAP
ncbi:MAG TPA: PTS sugar transporter subunit IIA, partial [Gammaproteobacteria bacterium]|nr:PTS sugar transporter subunit IIA [Gammaproteobacteria bacterium]